MPKSNRFLFKSSILFICLSVATIAVAPPALFAASPIQRLSVAQTRDRVMNNGALLVCSYADSRCKKILLEGAILRSEFEARLASLPLTQEIIFYCG